jgi:hypothetical protein
MKILWRLVAAASHRADPPFRIDRSFVPQGKRKDGALDSGQNERPASESGPYKSGPSQWEQRAAIR